MKKILFVLPGVLPVPAVKGGAVENLVQMLLEENEMNHKFDFSCISDFDENAVLKAKSFSHTNFLFIKKSHGSLTADKVLRFLLPKKLKSNKGLSSIFSRYNYVKQVEKHLKKNNYDFIILENHPTLLIPFKNKKLAKKFSDKIIYHAHNEITSWYGCEKQLTLLKSIFSVSEYVKKSMVLPKNIVIKNVCVFRNSIKEKLFYRSHDEKKLQELREKYGIKKNDFVFLYAGRIDEKKGVIELIKAFSALKKQNPDFNIKLLIIGAAFFGARIKSDFEMEIVSKVQENENIILTGYVDYEKLNLFYSLAEVCCFPSFYNEAASMVNIESLACGTPVITTRRGGIPEYVSGDCGILLDTESNDFVEDLRKAMLKLYLDADLRILMSKNGLETAKYYTQEKYFSDFDILYRKKSHFCFTMHKIH